MHKLYCLCNLTVAQKYFEDIDILIFERGKEQTDIPKLN